MLEDGGAVRRGHVGGRGAVMGVGMVSLAGQRRGHHVRWRGRALLVILSFALLVEGKSQPLPLLAAVAEPHAHHLLSESGNVYRKRPRTSITQDNFPLRALTF